MSLVDVLNAVKDNWQLVTLVLTSVLAIYSAVSKKAYQQAGVLAATLVAQVTVAELAAEDKRKQLVDAVYAQLPAGFKHFVSEADVLAEVDKLYALLKSYETPAAPPSDSTVRQVIKDYPVKSIDPTSGIIDVQNMEIKSPWIE